MVYILNCTNTEVTDFYLSIIGDMFVKVGENVQRCDKITRCEKKNDIFVVSTVNDFCRAYIAGYRHIFLWMQGISSEESYLKHGSNIRKYILDKLTKFSLVHCKGVFYVSKEMQDFEENKFRLSTEKKSFIMPCFNSTLNPAAFQTKDKYANNVFAYVGSLSKWQCFEETMDFYKRITEKIEDAELRVYTFSVEEAKKILSEKGVHASTVTCLTPIELEKALSDIKYGFVLREDISVNNVATPTKISSYLASGVIPIYSACLKDFDARAATMKYAISVESTTVIPEKLLKLCFEDIDAYSVFYEIKDLFDSYYCREKYVEQGGMWLGEIIDDCK